MAKAQQQTKPQTSKPAKEENKLQSRFQEVRNQAKEKIFYKIAEGDEAFLQILSRDIIPTSNGPSPRYKALYHDGNLHEEPGPGAPKEKGDTFFFWSSTMIESLFEENNVRAGDSLIICGLGEREGRERTYHDYAVSVEMRGHGQPLIEQSRGVSVTELEAGPNGS